MGGRAWRAGCARMACLRGRRLALAALAGALLLSAVLLGPSSPLQAQEGAVTIQFRDLSSYPTQTTVDRFEVDLTNLRATTTYRVVVSSDSPGLGIGGCGAARTRTVTGVTAQTLPFLAYACAVGEGTITAAVRQTGATTTEASVSQRLTVEPVPAIAPGSMPEAAVVAAAKAATARAAQAQVGRPGSVPSISFPTADRTATSVKVTWGTPSDGGRALTGFGLLFWRKGTTPPAYSRALVKGASARSHTYTGLQANTTYQFRIHACNGADSCGWWTHPPKEVTTKSAPPTVRAPGRVRNLKFSKDHASFTVRWDAPTDNGGAAITGYGILQWRDGTARPGYGTATTVSGRSKTYRGLQPNTKYWVTVHACNGRDRCGQWTSNKAVTTDPPPPSPTPAPTAHPTGRPAAPTDVKFDTPAEDSTSLTVSWTAPTDTGGRALTRFQLLRRRMSDTDAWPPVIQAATVNAVAGQTAYQYTYTGLQPTITYRVRIRACNGGTDTTDCSGWAESVDVTMPDGPPPPGAPGRVQSVSFANRTATSFKVTWAAPANNGGTALTGYGLQLKSGDDPWPPTSQVVVVGVTPRERTFSNLQAGTYWVRIQACNGKNSCYPWTKTKGHSVTIPPTTDQVQSLSATAGVGQLVVSWRAPADTGGKTITRYLVQYRIQGVTAWTTWPHTVTGTSVTIDNLRYDTTYDVQVRACYNANNAECGTAAQTTGTPSAGVTAPGPVQHLAVSPGNEQLVVSWEAPFSDGGAAITGYEVAYKQQAASAWTAWSHAGTGTTAAITSLTNSTAYDVRVRACNHGDGQPARCSTTWRTGSGTPTAGISAPGPVQNLNVSPGNGQLVVSWRAPASNGGAAITGYEVEYKERISSAWTAWSHAGTETTTTITSRTNGTLYDVRVRACNHGDGQMARCSTTWRTGSGTPTAGIGAPGPIQDLNVNPGNRQLLVRWRAPASDGGAAITGYEVEYKERISSAWSAWPHSGTATTATITDRLNGTLYDVRVRACNHAPSETARCSPTWQFASGTPELPRPGNLDVVPIVGREAELRWNPVSGAARYHVQVQILGTADWHDARCEGVTGGQPTQPECVIDLEYIATPGGTVVGLQHHKAYALQVRAVRPQASKFSSPIVIIDTPIFRAKGANTSAEVTWRQVDSINSNLNADGRYQLRYRRFLGDHRSVNWNPETAGFTPTTLTPLLPVGTTSHPIRNLVNYELFAIQLLYDAPQSNTTPIRVFAARDAYVWPSDRAAGVETDPDGTPYAGERVGTFPLSKPVGNRTYAYYICSDTFPRDMEPDEPDEPDPPDGIRAKSRAFIQDAFSQWEAATTTKPGASLITMKYMGTTCADYREPIESIVNTINSSVVDGDPPATIRMHVEDVIQQLGDLAGFLDQDKERSEVIFVDVPVEDRIGSSMTKRYVYFGEVSHRIGLNECVFTAEACAADEELNGVITTDILLNGGQFEKHAGAFNWDVPNVQFNTCHGATNADHSRYAVLVHEAGHAVGIRGTSQRSGGTTDQIHHSQVEDSVMKARGADICSPTPFDVMAIYALYQAQE